MSQKYWISIYFIINVKNFDINNFNLISNSITPEQTFFFFYKFIFKFKKQNKKKRESMVFFKLPFTFEYTIRKSLTVSNDKKNDDK